MPHCRSAARTCAMYGVETEILETENPLQIT